MLKKISALILLLLILSCSKKEAAKPAAVYREIPVEAFCQPPEISSYKLSADGGYSAYTKEFNRKINLFAVKNSDNSTQQLTYNAKADITDFIWVNNNLLAFTLDFNADGYHELYVMQPNRGGFKQLSGTEKSDYRLTNLKTGSDSEFFVEVSDASIRAYSLYKIDINSQKRKVAVDNPGNYLSYISDLNGLIRIATFIDQNGSGILYRKDEKSPFQPILRNTSQEVISPICFTADNQNLVVTANKGRDKAAIMEYDLAENKLGRILVEDGDTDIYEIIKSGAGEVVGAVVERDSLSFVYTNLQSEQIQKEVNPLFPGKTVKISDRSLDDNSLILEVFNGSHPGEICYYNRTAKKVNLLLNLASWLKDDELAPVKSVVLETNDKLKLFCYLTEPVKPNGAAVILAHGGPWIRDSKRYNAEAQFLANRGYLVMRVNFRGSLGFGRKFLERGYQEWGRGMINDLAFAAEWLKNERKIEKIGIAGTSFAGYSALRALQLYPDLFKCAVTQSALINIFDLRSKTYAGEADFNNITIGHPGRDANLLKNSSPYYNYSAMKAPVLFVYGENDQLVDLKQVDSLVMNLQKQGVTTEAYRKKKDGHILQDYQNMADYLAVSEKFLKKYLLESK